MISLDDVSVSYKDEREVLSHVTLHVNEGDFMAITGPNGGGKTSLLKIMLGLLSPAAGSVSYRWGGKEVKKLNIGYLPQKNAIDSRFPISVEEVVASGLGSVRRFLHRFTAEERDSITATLELVGLGEKRSEAIGEISGGQLQRALLGRAIISKPAVLILDEPLSYIDKTFEPRLFDIIGAYAKHSSIVLVSHEMTRIAQMANRHIIVDGGVHECHASRHYVPTTCE